MCFRDALTASDWLESLGKKQSMNHPRRLLHVFLLISVFGCTLHTPSPPDSNVTIIVEPSTSKDSLPAWLFYAAARAFWMEKKFFEQYPEATSYQYTFMEEVSAREGCARLWQEIRTKDARQNRYLDDLAAVHQSGFLREYVWVYFRDTDWEEPTGLRLTEFEQWRMIHLQSHKPETKAIARFGK
jgi:hypothetical protein